MKSTKITFWIITIILSIFIGLGSVMDVLSMPEAVLYITRLGYPAYLAPFLGAAKLAAIVVILIPGFPRLKEWAYAGLVIDLVGAMYSSIAIGDPASTWMPMLLFIALTFASYFFYHKKVKESTAVRTAMA
jgi:hypothetical protein